MTEPLLPSKKKKKKIAIIKIKNLRMLVINYW